MNERLRELYRQAHSVRTHDHDPSRSGNPPTVYWQGETSAERFAHAIIQDCIAQIALMGISNFENEDISWAMEKSIENIKQHFDIK